MSTLARWSRRLVLLAVAGLALCPSAARAAPVVVLDEDFNDVSGLPASASARSVADVLASTPGELPAGATASGVANVRRTDNTLNTSTLPSGLSGYFTPIDGSNGFLVLGDDAGPLGGSPEIGTGAVTLPFQVDAAAVLLTVSFDWAFAGASAASAWDVFDAFVGSATSGDVSLESLGSPRRAGSFLNAGTFFAEFLLDGFDPATMTLTFQLAEAASTTNTAVGLDDVVVVAEVLAAPAAVAGPASLLLVGAGAAALARRRRSR